MLDFLSRSDLKKTKSICTFPDQSKPIPGKRHWELNYIIYKIDRCTHGSLGNIKKISNIILKLFCGPINIRDCCENITNFVRKS